ncbi:MAG: hypothetical protein ABI977_11595 [Acidobacteriota bacterium]
MLRVLLNQDFDHKILHGLLRRIPELDYLTAYEAGWSELDDPDLLIEASGEQRVLFTHDLRTMPQAIADVIGAGHNIAGVFVVPRSLPLAQAINELELIVMASTDSEWLDSYRILPL